MAVKASGSRECKYVKRYFKEQGVPFKEINVERDQQAARDIMRKTGQTGVPVIKIRSSWIVGFDRERIERELARKAS
jgi:glutaredoxin 3